MTADDLAVLAVALTVGFGLFAVAGAAADRFHDTAVDRWLHWLLAGGSLSWHPNTDDPDGLHHVGCGCEQEVDT